MNDHRRHSGIHEESSGIGTTKRTYRAAQQYAEAMPSFTPEKGSPVVREVPDSSAAALETPYLQAQNMINLSPQQYGTQQTGELGKFFYEANNADELINDSLEEPSCAIDCQVTNDERTNFIMEKA